MFSYDLTSNSILFTLAVMFLMCLPCITNSFCKCSNPCMVMCANDIISFSSLTTFFSSLCCPSNNLFIPFLSWFTFLLVLKAVNPCIPKLMRSAMNLFFLFVFWKSYCLNVLFSCCRICCCCWFRFKWF